MFILRRITGEGNQVNECLGETYTFCPKETNKTEFYRAYLAYLDRDPYEEQTDEFKKSVENEVYAFITFKNGSEIIPLHRPSSYYIMTDSGATFANLTFK